VDFTGGFSDPSLWPVQPGDYLIVKGTAHLIQAVYGPGSAAAPINNSFIVLAPVAPFQPAGAAGAGTNEVTLANTAQISVGMSATWSGNPTPLRITKVNNMTPPLSITLSGSPPPLGTVIGFLPPASTTPTTYNVIRQPRVLTGETPLQLPAGICIDPTWPKYPGDLQVGMLPVDPITRNTDIMFSPQGNVMNLRGVDAVALWVRDYSKDLGPQLYPNQAPNTYPVSTWPPLGTPGDQFLILIQTHTGFIAEHPVDIGASGNPYSFTQDARSSGL
jgi:hypothetical protein